jgi:hypothetical protein
MRQALPAKYLQALPFLVFNFTQLSQDYCFSAGRGGWDGGGISVFRDRNWEVQAGSPDKIFDKKMSICLTKL